jgi:hypothetical protein
MITETLPPDPAPASSGPPATAAARPWTDSHGYAPTGRGFWPASPAEPFLQVVLDEVQELLTDIILAPPRDQDDENGEAR